jgi:hypothetical protein
MSKIIAEKEDRREVERGAYERERGKRKGERVR